jgi:hypothetical protein
LDPHPEALAPKLSFACMIVAAVRYMIPPAIALRFHRGHRCPANSSRKTVFRTYLMELFMGSPIDALQILAKKRSSELI